VGVPIRKSADQRLFAPPHGLSQRTTSFIASQRQGIHRIPLRHLIALIINAHPRQVARLAPCAGVIERPFASNMPENIAVKQMLTNWQLVFSNVNEAGSFARMQKTTLPLDKRSDMFPLHDDRQQRSRRISAQPRIRFIQDPSSPGRFAGDQTVWWSQTGSNRRPHACKARALPTELWPQAGKNSALNKMVGLGRLELPTSRLSSARSNQLSYKPKLARRQNLAVAAPSFAHRPHPKSLTTFRADAMRAGSSLDRRKRNEDGGCPARSA
jgi:hypothetical protein